MSKSGLFAHFGSKEELQLATVDHAAALFRREVIDPAREAPQGVARVWALCERMVDYSERQVFPGGCFFASASAEFNNRPGPVRDRVGEMIRAGSPTSSTRSSRRRRPARSTTRLSARDLAFQLDAFAQASNAQFQLFRDARLRRGAARDPRAAREPPPRARRLTKSQPDRNPPPGYVRRVDRLASPRFRCSPGFPA